VELSPATLNKTPNETRSFPSACHEGRRRLAADAATKVGGSPQLVASGGSRSARRIARTSRSTAPFAASSTRSYEGMSVSVAESEATYQPLAHD
jgi:hypothetical protein